jgi:hypothetical protein
MIDTKGHGKRGQKKREQSLTTHTPPWELGLKNLLKVCTITTNGAGACIN